MSRKTRAVAKFRGWGKRAGHSDRTRTSYMNILRYFIEVVFAELGLQIDGPEDLTVDLLKQFVAYLVVAGNSSRSIQNKLSVIRRVLTLAGRGQFAQSKALRSRNLGTPAGSRDGTNSAIEDAEYERILRIATKASELGIVAVLMLQRTIGLRRQEGIMADRSLEEWEWLILQGLPVPVRHGAKNGRLRYVEIPDWAAALRAVRFARDVANAQGGRLILGETLEIALAHYSNFMHEWIGVKGHSLRYAFAKDLYFHLRKRGLSEDQAWPLVSDSLGHGLNREDLMRCVYLKGVIARKARSGCRQ